MRSEWCLFSYGMCVFPFKLEINKSIFTITWQVHFAIKDRRNRVPFTLLQQLIT